MPQDRMISLRMPSALHERLRTLSRPGRPYSDLVRAAIDRVCTEAEHGDGEKTTSPTHGEKTTPADIQTDNPMSAIVLRLAQSIGKQVDDSLCGKNNAG